MSIWDWFTGGSSETEVVEVDDAPVEYDDYVNENAPRLSNSEGRDYVQTAQDEVSPPPGSVQDAPSSGGSWWHFWG